MTEWQLTFQDFEARLIARRMDPPPSKAAARRMAQDGRLGTQQQLAWDLLKAFGPATTREIARQAALGDPWKETWLHHMLARRFVDLEHRTRATCHRHPVTRDTCTKVCTVTGEPATLWEAL